MRPQDPAGKDKLSHFPDEAPELPSGNLSSGWPDLHSSDGDTAAQPRWWDGASAAPEGEAGLVGVLPPGYDGNGTLREAERPPAGPLPFPPVQMVLSWLPPKPPTAFDGFHIHVQREGKATGHRME